jgi:type VI secretion system protein VasJ
MPTFREEAAERIAPLVAPIAGANPAGADVSYDPEFEKIKGEIDKLSSVDNREPAWRDVLSLGVSILSSKGKDLRVASWMGVAKLKLDGWKGFADTLLVLDGLSRNFWDTMWPEARRARGRVNAISWMAEQAVQQLQGVDVGVTDGDAVRAADEILKELDQILADKLGELYQGPGQLRSLMRDKVRAIPAAPAEAPPPPPAADGGAAPAAAAPVVQAAPEAARPTSVGDVDKALGQNAEGIIASATLLRQSDATRAWAYRLHRWGCWLRVEAPPETEGGNKTFIPPPSEDTSVSLRTMRESQSWPALLNAAEEASTSYIFWLDPQRYAAHALDGLGATHAAAREALGREVIAFVSRVPGLVDLTFSDGTPFADAATKTWLEEEAKKWGASVGTSVATSAEDEEVAARFEEAQKMVTEGKVPDALRLGLALAARAPDARMRFRGRLTVGKMALDGSKPELARPILEHMCSDVEQYSLETWEPALCATLYAYLLQAVRELLRASNGSTELETRAHQVFDKLCRLDPASAIKFSS